MRPRWVEGGRKEKNFHLAVQPFSERPVMLHERIIAVFVCEVAFLSIPEVSADVVSEGAGLDMDDLLHGDTWLIGSDVRARRVRVILPRRRIDASPRNPAPPGHSSSGPCSKAACPCQNSSPFLPFSSTTMSNSATLPVLTLPQPLVLLPTARVQVPLDDATGTRLIELVQRSETQLVIGTVPYSSSSSVHPWGTAARVVRIVRPLSKSPQRLYHVTLHGLSRIYFPDTKSQAPFAPSDLIELKAEYPKPDGPPTPETVAPFRAAASKLLEGLAQDATQQSRKDVYAKISQMMEEVSDDRTPWMADVIVAGINKVEYDDKLGES